MSASLSRRGFLQASTLGMAAASLGLPLVSRTASAQLPPRDVAMDAADAVLLNYNENPHGPFPEATQAAIGMVAKSGRYLFEDQMVLAELFASQNGLKPEQVMVYAGSGVAIDAAALAFTSARAGLVIPDPTFEAVADMAGRHGARISRVPLLADASHDVEKMAAVDPSAGLIYVCNPNNPTGSVTTRAQIDWLLAHKPKDAILLVDEAYIHFSDARHCLDLVAAGQDVVVLRTFSKIYGMAGLRLGLAAARPDLLARMMAFGVNSMPVPTVAAGIASLRNPAHLAERKAANTQARVATIDWLTAHGYACMPSEANCFMVDVKGDAKAFAAKLAQQHVFVGRSWPILPQSMRVTVGTAADMQRFREAFAKVMVA